MNIDDSYKIEPNKYGIEMWERDSFCDIRSQTVFVQNKMILVGNFHIHVFDIDKNDRQENRDIIYNDGILT